MPFRGNRKMSLRTLMFRYPPRNRIVVLAHIRMRLLYSARKKNTKGLPEYSVKNPATSSLSASTRSNGGLFVSATVLMKKMINSGKSGMKSHTIRCVSM